MPNGSIKIGDRITLRGALVREVTEHTGTDIYERGSKTFWRHAVTIDFNNRPTKFVFSGKYLGLHFGDIIDIIGTVRKFENKFNYIRLNRVKLIAKNYDREKELNL